MIFDITKKPIFKDHRPDAWYLKPSNTENADRNIIIALSICFVIMVFVDIYLRLV